MLPATPPFGPRPDECSNSCRHSHHDSRTAQAPALRPTYGPRRAAQARPVAAPPAPARALDWRIALVVTPILIAAGFVCRPATRLPWRPPPPVLTERAASPGGHGPGRRRRRQTLDLVVNGTTMSYKPSVIQVKQGVPVRFNLSVEGRDPGCGRFVGLRGLGEHGIATPGR